MREYKLIKAQPYLCVCAALQSVLLRHGYALDQLEIAKQLGVTRPKGDCPWQADAAA